MMDDQSLLEAVNEFEDDLAEGEEIDYYDYTSLYPYVNKNGEYPLKHPEIIFQPGHTDISCYFGIAQCTVLPPYELYHPVLPFRQNDKLTFPLCRSCVEEEMTKPMLDRSFVCNHNDKQRQILGTWCTPELEKAVEKGYQIIHIHEVWHLVSFVNSLKCRNFFLLTRNRVMNTHCNGLSSLGVIIHPACNKKGINFNAGKMILFYIEA